MPAPQYVVKSRPTIMLGSLIRRKLMQMGRYLTKSRRRDPNALDFGGYMICDIETDGVVAGAEPIPFSMTLDEVEGWVND